MQTTTYTQASTQPSSRPAPAERTMPAPGSWATDPSLSFEEKMRRWVLFSLMKQRGIEWNDIREELGVTRARLGQIFRRAGVSETAYLRIEDAIGAITERKHAALCECQDLHCAVYTCADPDERLKAAKLGALEDWRNR